MIIVITPMHHIKAGSKLNMKNKIFNLIHRSSGRNVMNES